MSAERHRVSLQRRLGQVESSSGCLKTDSALARGRDELQRKVTRRKSHTFKQWVACVCSLLSYNWLKPTRTGSGEEFLGVPQDRRRSCTWQRYDATEGHPSEIQYLLVNDHHGYVSTCSRRVSKSLLLSKVPPRPTWYSPLASFRISATAAREARPPSRCFLRWYQALAMGSF